MSFFPHVAPRLRPWMCSGLEYVLVDDAARVAALSRSAAESRPGSIPAETARPTRQIGPKPAPVGSDKEGRTAPPHQGEGAVTEVRPQPPRETGLAPDGKAVLPQASWPLHWKQLRDRRPLPLRPMVVWTYTGLGDDLVGQALVERQQVIAKMIKALRHPGGTHVFWPHSLPNEGAREGEPGSLFWSGIAILRPRVILAFGRETGQALGLPAAIPFYRAEPFQGRRVVILPEPLELAGEESSFSRAHVFLASMLKFCAQR